MQALTRKGKAINTTASKYTVKDPTLKVASWILGLIPRKSKNITNLWPIDMAITDFWFDVAYSYFMKLIIQRQNVTTFALAISFWSFVKAAWLSLSILDSCTTHF